MTGTKVLALRTVPLLGWVGLLAGLVYVRGRKPWPHPAVRVAWWIDAVLSVGVHTLQIPVALRHRHDTGHSRSRTALMTFVFGLTWWKTVKPTAAATAITEEDR
ncbi:hypothetical protein G4H71_11410 [Rhodococcus triatomae]|uniref:hypothetical protein n=1 Tax=Rhodococcus triatomae TaxID=300028 RepID=UPI0009F32E40|nr:hypothetical protein [Rhodococcus triatomae]QNG20519.1 hypothetical protein G4H72_18970 [Rhodococcus triatomae]QNG23563.1 hypothetical protein G4H71_11410 [Rhodococcus triatomae]